MAATARCKLWLPKKNRHCSNTPLKDSIYCGNHNPKSEENRIPCPLDPSHSVLKENLEAHVKKCPLLKQTRALEEQSYYKKGVNAGTDEEEEENCGNVVTSNKKRSLVYKMGVVEFLGLVGKIRRIHGSVCSEIRESYKIPDVCSLWMNNEVERKLPFQEKHVLQQASILGNMQEIGVLDNPVKYGADTEIKMLENVNGVPAIVEFGAGRGYLTQILADCYGIEKVFLVERRSYKLKADRSLRQKDSLMLERLRIDIEDLDLVAVEQLRGVPYLAIGKHLCGPATDLTLRCCLHQQCSQEKNGDSCTLRGLAIATCCHHLCQWKHYINKSYFLKLGITKNDFHAITWFTSWSVDADHGSDLSDVVDLGQSQNPDEKSNNCSEISGVEEVVKKMTAVERAVLGLMCKDIIDMGRLLWTKEHKFEAQLVKYVPPSVSPENRLLVAKVQ